MRQEQFVFLCLVVKAMRIALHIGRAIALIGVVYAWHVHKNSLNLIIISFLLSLFFWIFYRKSDEAFLNGLQVDIVRIGKIGRSEPFIIVATTLFLMHIWEVISLWWSIKLAFW